MERFDVVVVGAGPAGSAAAGRAASLGLSTLVLEEHATVGHPVQCAGLLSTGALAECRVSDRSVRNRVRGARLISDLGGELAFDAGTTKAVVVDRGELDREMAAAALDAGAELRPKSQVRRVGDGRVTVTGPAAGEVGFSVLVAADGPRGTVARSLGMARTPLHLGGVQADVVLREPAGTHLVEVYPNAAPEFFAWRIPVSDRVVRVGLCGETGVPELFSRFLARWPGGVVHRASGTIPLGTMPRTFGRRTLFVGDAAGLAKPTSGGGVFTGVRSGRYAAETAAECLESGDLSDTALASYEARWKGDFGRELAMGYRLLGARRRVTPGEVDRLLRAFGDPRVIRSIVEHGDMDRPSGLLARLVRMPALWTVIPIILRLGIGEILAGDGAL
ncbi:MAG: NAD(P)/FAD-dependent oxidoreductase [Methanospirillum sp.]|nr:NAD(P)/FAD-dependent oxidoreductase [Methanospirillum sp.]